MIDHSTLVMMCYSEQQFIRALRKEPERRSMQDLQVIYTHLGSIEALSKLRESALRSLCKMVRYERHPANDILYCRGEMASCWFILLSGAVFIDGSMFLPRSSFGKRIGGAARRHNECLILEPSEMIVIDYVDGRARTERISDSSGVTSMTSTPSGQSEVTIQPHGGSFVDDDFSQPPAPPPRTYKVLSHSSDSSSAYSGSDTMQSASGGEVEEVDLTGLLESVVDSDEEEEDEDCSLVVRDAVRECLEKDPADRTDDDIEVLLEFTQHLKAFTNMTMSVRRALVATMVFAVVEKAGTVVMTEGEELDSWSVIINGHVEIEHATGQPSQELHLGDSFGITPTMEKLYHRGVMRTKCDDCQFICVTQTDYYRILSQGEENQRRHEEDGNLVMVTEPRSLDGGTRKGHIVIRGTPDRLTSQLMEDNSTVDPTFIEDFLLTYRTFLDSPVVIANQLLEWFKEPQLRDKVTRVLLLWVNNHFTDFETDPRMMGFLERFETCLEGEKMQGQLRMLNFACAAKARKRIVTLTRPSRDDPLQFSIVGGYERGFGIFISRVEKGSKAEEIGLKRGDQILEVNGQSFEHVTKHTRALEILKGVCHLSITVKSNLLAFQEMLQTPEDTPRARSRGKSVPSPNSLGGTSDRNLHRALSGDGSFTDPPSRDSTPTPRSKPGRTSLASTSKAKFNKAFRHFLKPKSDDTESTMYANSLSNPDLREAIDMTAAGSCNQSNSDPKSEYPEHVLKVYKADQTFKYLLVHKETTAHEVVMLSLQEFGITETSSNFTLCEVSVAEGGFVKQRRLPDALQNLAERIGLASRYYIKNVHSSESLLPDDVVSDLMKESNVSLLQLNPVEVSTQLMVEDFTIFRQIEATEYVDELFELKSRYGTPSLGLFANLVNREMMWSISEIVGETNVTKRMRVIKQFIKVARQCKETQNFNSMFAIISGLGHGSVSRLKSTWEKLPSKYQRMFNEMQQLMDPSRNMSRYRNLVNADNVQPPIIPFYPVVKKDLTFIHLANDSKVDSLVNFEKLRMIAKEVRTLTNMCSAPLDLFSMLELGGQQPSNAMVAMNQLTTGGQHLATVNRRRKKHTGVPNPKRMFEEAQMVRRVKAYLKNMKIIFDEERLHQMSLECEAPPGGHTIPSIVNTTQSSQPTFRKRTSSPTPSAMSSTSSASHQSDKKAASQTLSPAHPKFGAASPQAVKKLLALSEQSKSRASKVSPLPNRKLHVPSPAHHNHHHVHHHHNQGPQDSPSLPPAVDLTAESSSVTSLPVRKVHNTGSVTSTDSGLGSFDHHHHHLVPYDEFHTRLSPRLHPRRHHHHHRKPRSMVTTLHHAIPAEVRPEARRNHIPSYYVTDDDDDETQVSAV